MLAMVGGVVGVGSESLGEGRLPGPAPGGRPAQPDLPEVTARPSDAFVDSIGVNTHLRYSDTGYDDFERLRTVLVESGIRHIRDELVTGRPEVIERFRRLGRDGITATLILGDPDHGGKGDPWGTVPKLVALLEEELLDSGVVGAVEGVNEWDLTQRSEWSAEARAHQQEIWRAIKGDDDLADVPVLAPSLGRPNDRARYDRLGDLSDVADYGNLHNYPGGVTPAPSTIDGQLANQARTTPARPVITTETGYHQSPEASDQPRGHPAVSPEEAGALVPRILAEHFDAGIERTFIYELLDQFDEPERTESNFGLLQHDYAPKPPFSAIVNLIGLLEDPGPAFDPTPLGYVIGEREEDVGDLLLQDRDGTWYLLLWRRVQPGGGDPCERSGDTVTVELSRLMDAIVVHRPQCGERTDELAPSGAATVPLDDDLVVLELRPAR